MSLCVKHKGNYFQFCDVVGDGNCLHSALSMSPEINGNAGDEVWFVMFIATLLQVAVCFFYFSRILIYDFFIIFTLGSS